MSEQEKKKSNAKLDRIRVRSAEDLLSDFGASPKKAAEKPEEKAPQAAPPVEAPVPRADEPVKPAEEATKKPTARKTASTAPRAKTTSKSTNEAEGKKTDKKKQSVKATTATRDKHSADRNTEKESKEDSRPRSKMPIHRILPYLLALAAIYIGLSLVLNLFCNRGNVLSTHPSDHYMGLLGYYLCEAIFGTFGPAAFVLPILLGNLAIFWRKFADHRVIISKIVSSLIFLVALGALVHVLCLEYLEPSKQINYSVAQLYEFGAEMTSGGVVGGKVGYLCFYAMSTLGSVIVGTFLLLLSLLYTFGTTPEKIRKYFREGRKAKQSAKAAFPSEAPSVKKQETAEKTRGTNEKVPVESAPAEEFKQKRTREDKIAPMPLPQLDPGNDMRPFIPSDVNRKLHEEQRSAVNQARTAEVSAQAQKPAPQAPAEPLNPAKNKDAAIDPIFPKTAEFKQPRKIPKEDRNFDLRNVFVDLEDDEQPKMPRAHSPVPPEVPLGAPRTSSKPSAPTSAPTTVKPAATPAPAKSVAAKPATQPIIKAAEVTHTDYGLSAEEFEKREAGQHTIPSAKPKTATAKSTEKPAEKPASVKAEEPKKYVFPPISYLRAGEPMTAENKAEIEANSTQLTNTLANFRVGVEEVNYSYGPTVTRYELVLSPGVRVRSVLNLSDDIALALRSSGGVRIEAPIPGTNAVGIEVPNKTRSTIYLRDLIESKEFQNASGKLSSCLGAGIAGESLIFDIAKMPHLLIAGTTGSGKSVCINCIIVSLLYRVRPDEVKLVLIDPKKVEFSIYKNIPHLMAPVVTTPKDAAGALQAAVEEMERRFEMFESVGVRDLKGYVAATANDPDMPKIPHMVIIIDELADLMMTAKNEVETAICRIAQKARAAGMHLIIGTQRPSADVVTGLIKANVPSCIAFAVKSQIDSRVILDHGGAEALTGRGDMLFVPIGSMRDTRVQGAFVDDKEVERICEFLRATNGTAQYDERFNAKLKELAAQCGKSAKTNDDVPVSLDGEKGDDPKYADAVRVAVEEKRISTSLLQRKLQVGYGRAAKLIDRMQAEGIVSPPDGSKPRSILISNEEYIERFMMSDGEENA